MADANDTVESRKLWPSVDNLKTHWDVSDGGYFPDLISDDLPAWKILDDSNEKCLKKQLGQLLSSIGGHIPKSLGSDISIDETKGVVHISEGAIIGPFSRFEGPCYIAPEAEIRHGAFVRSNSWICYQAVLGHATSQCQSTAF